MEQNNIEVFKENLSDSASKAVIDASKDGFGGAYVRESANISTKSITSSANGTKVTLLETTMLGWSKVKLENGTVGYVISDYIKAV